MIFFIENLYKDIEENKAMINNTINHFDKAFSYSLHNSVPKTILPIIFKVRTDLNTLPLQNYDNKNKIFPSLIHYHLIDKRIIDRYTVYYHFCRTVNDFNVSLKNCFLNFEKINDFLEFFRSFDLNIFFENFLTLDYDHNIFKITETDVQIFLGQFKVYYNDFCFYIHCLSSIGIQFKSKKFINLYCYCTKILSKFTIISSIDLFQIFDSLKKNIINFRNNYYNLESKNNLFQSKNEVFILIFIKNFIKKSISKIENKFSLFVNDFEYRFSNYCNSQIIIDNNTRLDFLDLNYMPIFRKFIKLEKDNKRIVNTINYVKKYLNIYKNSFSNNLLPNINKIGEFDDFLVRLNDFAMEISSFHNFVNFDILKENCENGFVELIDLIEKNVYWFFTFF
ncbi:hypothetical protein GVAV_003230 [Gurleya vavrai]